MHLLRGVIFLSSSDTSQGCKLDIYHFCHLSCQPYQLKEYKKEPPKLCQYVRAVFKIVLFHKIADIRTYLYISEKTLPLYEYLNGKCITMHGRFLHCNFIAKCKRIRDRRPNVKSLLPVMRLG